MPSRPDCAEQARKLAALLEMDARELQRKLAARRVTSSTSSARLRPKWRQRWPRCACRASDEQREYRRYYPGGEVTAHLLGFTDIDDKWPGGYRTRLRGPADRQVRQPPRDQGSSRQIVEDVESIRPPQDGARRRAVALDRQDPVPGLSRAASEAINEHQAKAGGVVVLDARSGEVLALANCADLQPEQSRQR